MREFFEDPELQKYMLIFARLSGIVIFVPLFYSRRLALQLKGGLVFFLTIAMYPAASNPEVILPATFPGLGLGMLFEVFLGLIIGLALQFMFAGFQIAGEFIDRHIGFAMASLVDPQSDVTVSLLATLLMNLGLYVFLELNLHGEVLRTFAGSFRSVPLLYVNYDIDGIVFHMSKLFFESFVFALKLSLPIIMLMSLIYISLGFIQRTIPALHVFVIGFIFTITMGMISVRTLVLQIEPIMEVYMDGFMQEIWFMITSLGNG